MSELNNIGATVIMLLFWVTLYFLPSIISRKKAFGRQVFFLNLFAGWTVVGWMAALIWAVKREQENQNIIIHNHENNNNDIDNIAQLEKLSQLYQQGILTQVEFTQQKNKLLGKKIINPIEQASPQKNNQIVNIAIITILASGLALIAYGVFGPSLTTPESAVGDFLRKIETNEPLSEFYYYSVDYNRTIRKPNTLPQITTYNILSSTEIDSLPGYYFVFANVFANDESRSVTFLVKKSGSVFSIENSYDFLNSGTNQIVFPSNMGDSKRIKVAQQNSNVQIILSTCKMVNNRAAGSIQVKNNFVLPVKNIKIQVQYLDKQQQEVKAEIVNAITGDDEIQSQQGRIISWVTDECNNCVTANITIINNNY